MIGASAFSGTALSKVSFPNGLQSIGERAFEGCSLRVAELPDGLISIGANAFPGFYACIPGSATAQTLEAMGCTVCFRSDSCLDYIFACEGEGVKLIAYTGGGGSGEQYA